MKTLYIIGNGFDIAHGLPTCYYCFRKWLMKNGYSYFIENMEMFFSHWDRDGKKDLLWNDFERALGACNFEETYNMFADQSREYFGNGTEYLRDISNSSDEHFTMPLTYEMPKLFTTWIQTINEKITNISEEKLKLMNIDENDLFLNFNFTDTLEQAYNILPSQICHIHNCISAGEKPIIGHNTTFNIRVPYDMTRAESELKQSLANVLNEYKKDYKANIRKNDGFYSQIDKQVNTLCFYGHSLGDIDLPYFKDLKKRVLPTSQWIFYIYKGENEEQFTKNKNAVLSFIRKMKLDVQNCKAYDSEFMNQGIQL